MKKTLRIVIDIIIIRASLDCFIGLAWYYAQPSFARYVGYEAKIFCYALCAFCYIGAFKMISQKIKTMWLKGAFAFAPAMLFTTQLLFINPLLQFLNMNYSGNHQLLDELIPYSTFLKGDFAYKSAAHQYLLCFTAMYALCSFVILFNSKAGVKIRKKIGDPMKTYFDFSSPGDFEILIDLYQRGRINSEALADFYKSIGLSDYEKEEFKRCIAKYPCKILFELFFIKFATLLSKEEIEYYDSLSKYYEDVSLKQAGKPVE